MFSNFSAHCLHHLTIYISHPIAYLFYAMLSTDIHTTNTAHPRKKTQGQEEKNKPEGRLNIKITT